MYYFTKFIFVLLSLYSVEILAVEYGLDAKFDGVSRIARLQIFSERCSGSNYIENLVYQNIQFYPPARSYPPTGPYNGPFGHKHFPPSFEIPLERYKEPKEFYTFDGNEDTLFIVIFRNPYDWVRSFNKQTHHSIHNLKRLPFSEFIRKEWELNINDEILKKSLTHNPFADRDPITGKLFNNVLKLRTSKILTMLELKNRVNNIYYINYETALLYPNEVIDEIATLFNLGKKNEFSPVLGYKGASNEAYKPKKYNLISQKDLNFINSQLDPKIEQLIGYEVIKSPSLIP